MKFFFEFKNRNLRYKKKKKKIKKACVVNFNLENMSTIKRIQTKKDTWLRWTFKILCLLVHSTNSSQISAYPTVQQEHDLIILDALSRRSGTGYYGENSVMEMLARSIFLFF